MDRRLAAGDLHDVRLPSLRHDGVEHALDVIERAEHGRSGPLDA
jgi:hypothetical protein